MPEDAAGAVVGPGAAAAHPPLAIRSNPLLGRFAATVCAIVHDEMFFLPAFLAHYRALGADRFVILDDRSTDGTADYLAHQPDVMVVESPLRYFEEVAYDPATRATILETRAVRLWRDQLVAGFCTGQWAAVVDPDEFLALPAGGLPALARRLEAEGATAAWGAMVDMYPAAIGEITGARARAATRFDLAGSGAGPWYFDARPHLDPGRLRETPPVPRTVYPGSVARLFAEWDVLPQGSAVRRLRRRLSGYRYQGASMIHKTPFLLWEPGDRFLNCHVTSKPARPGPGAAGVSARAVVPIMHFKFTADLGRKIEYALATGGYNQGSRSYRLYATLIERMRAADARFLGRASRRYREPADFAAAGIAR